MIGRIMMLLFIIIPIAEFYVLVELGKSIGVLNTIVIVVISAMVGVSFTRSQGMQILRRMQSATNQGQIPGRELVEGALVLIGGFLLIFPGLITDFIGLTLLFPFTRVLYIKLILAYFRKKYRDGQIEVYLSYHYPPHIPTNRSYDYSDDSDDNSDDDPPRAMLK